MGEWRRLFYYLLLNVLVSAVTTLAVLILWDKMQLSSTDLGNILPLQNNSQSAEMALPTFESTVVGTSVPEERQNTPVAQQATLPANTPIQGVSTDAQLVIESVIGVGDLATEKILVKRTKGEGELSLANWRIQGNKGQEYVFPQLILHKGGAVYIHTNKGVDTVIDLYWGRSEAAWGRGAVVTLKNEQGITQATYIIP